MALRLRRGTDAERLLITPVSGELIYTTDTKLLYIGDGTTAGGTLVTGGAGSGASTLDALTDTDLTGATNNDVLKFNAGTNKWEPSIAGGSTLDALTDTDLTGAAGGEVLSFNNVTSKWESVAVPGLSALSLDDLTDVFLTSNPAEAGDVLQFNGNHFVAVATVDLFNEQQNYKINIVGDDSTIMINTDNNNIVGNEITANLGFVGDLTGTVEGAVIGDLKGSVFGDDSSVIIDGVTNSVITPLLTVDQVRGDNTKTINFAAERLSVYSDQADPALSNSSELRFFVSRGTTESPQVVNFNDSLTTFSAHGWTGADYGLIGAINFAVSENSGGAGATPGRMDFIIRDEDDAFDASFARLESNGLWTAAALQTLGQTTAKKTALLDKFGGVGGEAGLQGAIVYDTTLNALTTFHPTDGWGNILTSTAPVVSDKYFGIGSYATISLPGTTAGTIAFDSTTNEFKGYNGTTWVVLG